MASSRASLRGSLLSLGVGGLLLGCGGGGPGGGMTTSGDEVTLLEVQAQVFSPSCALTDCHSGPNPPLDLDLSSLGSSATNLLRVMSREVPGQFRVEPYNAADSYLYWKITADPRIEGDSMPALGAPLSAADIALIESWIERGAM